VQNGPYATNFELSRDSFHRRRKYPVLSGDWLHEVNSARRFIAAYRAIMAGESTPAFRRAFVTRREPGDVSDGP
jgi:hypothetical protein